jgi:hypothetical protein
LISHRWFFLNLYLSSSQTHRISLKEEAFFIFPWRMNDVWFKFVIMKATEYFRVVVDVVLCRINAMMNDSTFDFFNDK